MNCAENIKISSRAFKSISRQYSDDCWNEAIEELAVTYSFEELEGIQAWLTGGNRIMTYDILKERAANKLARNSNCAGLVADIDGLLQRLYKVGIIGNYKKLPNGTVRQRWYFRGDDVLLTDWDIQIHKIFSEKLSIYS